MRVIHRRRSTCAQKESPRVAAPGSYVASLLVALAHVHRVGVEHEVADPLLRGGVGNRAEKREAAALAVDAERARREGHVAPRAAVALPDGEPDQLQALQG